MGTEGFFGGKEKGNKPSEGVSREDTSKRAFDGGPSIYDIKVPIRPSQNGPRSVLKTGTEQQVPREGGKTEEIIKGEANKRKADEFVEKELQRFANLKKAREVNKVAPDAVATVSRKGTEVASGLSSTEDFYRKAIGESLPESLHDTGFGLADVDEFKTSAVLSEEKIFSEEDIADSLESERKIGQIFGREKEEIRQDAEQDLKVKWFEKEAYEFPERSDAVWDKFVVANPIEALLYREHNPGIRSALERKEAEVEVPKKESKLEKQKFFDTRFKTEFGITKEQISQIEGYERLSEGQQKLVLENLQEYAHDTRGGITARTWEGILKAVGRDTKDKNYIDATTVLIRNTAQFGPKVHEENGELLVDLVGDVKFNREHRAEEKAVVDRFNALAHEYAKIKASNFEENTGTKRKIESKIVTVFKNIFSDSRQEFDTTEHLYENAKQELVKVLSAQGMSEGKIAERLIQIDSKVHVLRFLQTELEAVGVIKQGTEQTFLQKIGKKFLTNTPYALLGLVGRFATAETMGFFASPAVAGVIGGIRSWDKTSAELRERDRAVRMGEGGANPKVLELQKKIKNVILERNTLKPSSNINDSIRDIELRQWLDRYNADLVSMGTELNIVDATREIKVGQGEKKDVGLTQKLRDLIHEYQIETAKDSVTDEEKTKTLERILARVAYVEDKLNLNRINFGSGAERSLHMANLFETLGEAKILLADAEMPKGSELEARLERYLIKREGLIQTRRRMKQIKIAAKDTLIAGSFATAGALLSDYVFSHGLFSKDTSIASGVAVGSKAPSLVDTGTSPQAQVEYESGMGQGAESSKPGSVVQETQARGAVPENAPEIQKSAPYTIKAGDTLTKILKEQTPSIKELGNTQAQENAVANILRSLTPDEMDSIGLSSHSIENIRVDDSIDVEKLNAIIAEKKSIIESAQNRFGDEPVRSYTEASPRSGSQQIEISKDIDAPGASPKPDEVTTPNQGREESSGGKLASDVVLEQQAEDSSLRSEEEAPRAEAQQKSPAPSEPIIQPASPPEKIIEIEDAPVKRIEANDHVPSKFPEEGVRIPKDLEVGDISVGGQTDGGSIESGAHTPESTIPDYSEDGGTALDTESNAPEAKSTPGVHSPQETFKNTYGTEIDPKKEDIYELTGRGGEKVMVSYGGKNFETRFDFAQEYVKKNPDAAVIVEEEPRYGAFGQKLPPSYVEVRYVRGEGVTTIFSIQDDTLPASSEKGIDPGTFTKKVTK